MCFWEGFWGKLTKVPNNVPTGTGSEAAICSVPCPGGPGPHLGIIVNPRECQTASFLFQWCEKWETGCMVRVYWLWSHCGQFGATFWRERNCGPARPPWTQSTGSHGAAQARGDRESVLAAFARHCQGFTVNTHFHKKGKDSWQSIFLNLSVQCFWVEWPTMLGISRSPKFILLSLIKSIWHLLFKRSRSLETQGGEKYHLFNLKRFWRNTQ